MQKNQGLLHQNYGDFYSEVAHEDWGDRIYRLLQKANVADGMRIVPAGSFDEKILDSTKEYIITETTGIRLYAPHLHQEEEDPSLGSEVAYFFLSLSFLEDPFYAKKEGVLQKQFKEKTRGLKELLAISSELTHVNAEMRSLARELKRWFPGKNQKPRSKLRDMTDNFIAWYGCRVFGLASYPHCKQWGILFKN